MFGTLLPPSVFRSKKLSEKKKLISSMKCNADDKRCHESHNVAYSQFFNNHEIDGLEGMTTLTLNGGKINIVVLGERHSTSKLSNLVYDLISDCKNEIEVFVEDHISSRDKLKKLSDISGNFEKGSMFELMFNPVDCDKVNFHVVDLRSLGLMKFLGLVKERFEDEQEEFELLDLAVELVEGEMQLAQKIYHTQLRNVSSKFMHMFERVVNEQIQTWIIEARKDAAEGRWVETLDSLNYTVDHMINMYGLLRVSRDDLDSPHRLFVVGELHRRQLDHILSGMKRMEDVMYESVTSDDVIIVAKDVKQMLFK